MQKVVSLACIRQNSILLVRKKHVWILPGGKLQDESHDRCLKREFSEELPGTEITLGALIGIFHGVSPLSQTETGVIVYIGMIKGELRSAAEIDEARFVQTSEFPSLEISELTRQVLQSLQDRHFFPQP